MRILVAGGAGYVGSHVVKALLESGHEPVVYDNLSTGHAESVQGAELVVGDVGDRQRLDRVFRRRFDGVIHLAAVSLVGESVRNPSQYFDNNVAKGLTFLDAIVTADVPWIVLSSTAAVYGDPLDVPIPEGHSTKPTNPYGESKLMLERVLHWYEKAYGLKYASLRYFNASGAHACGHIGEDHTPETHLIPIVLQAALGQREEVAVFGTDYATPDGSAIRDYVHVCDLAAAHLAVVERFRRGGASDMFNLGSERGYSVLEILEAARRVTGREFQVRMADRRPGDPPVLVASSSRANSELNWFPRYDLNDILETAWQWHMKHPRGFAGVD